MLQLASQIVTYMLIQERLFVYLSCLLITIFFSISPCHHDIDSYLSSNFNAPCKTLYIDAFDWATTIHHALLLNRIEEFLREV